MITTDIVVLGGGPAGTATALTLAQVGLAVAVLERSSYDTARVGETLPPAAAPLFRSLGVWEPFLRTEHEPSPGIVSVWGSEVPHEQDFIFNPYGNGWHLDRRRFDEMLATAVEERGAVLYRYGRVLACSHDGAGCWQIDVQTDKRLFRLKAPFLVDATGRASWLGRRLGARRVARDRLVGVVGLFHCRGAESDRDSRMLLEAVEDGWWYAAPLPDNRLTIAYMTDLDLLPIAPRNLGEFWAVRLEQARHTLERIGAATRQGDLRTVSANSYRMDPVVGENWLAVGDAAMAWDPLSGQGLVKAMESALHAAQAFSQVGSRGPQDYAERVSADWKDYLTKYAAYYGAEKRWSHSPFWQRRHQLARAPDQTTAVRPCDAIRASIGVESVGGARVFRLKEGATGPDSATTW
jgi:flavin-dependent dehydrogenase